MVNAPADALNQHSLGVTQVASAWPVDLPLAMLHSAGEHPRWGRWSLLSRPDRFAACEKHEGDVSAWLRRELEQSRIFQSQFRNRRFASPRLPFTGGWLGCFSYELGKALEPAAQFSQAQDAPDSWPLVELAHCPAALVYDNLNGYWHVVGDTEAAADLVDRLDLSKAHDDPAWEANGLAAAVPADAHLAAVTRTLEYIAAGDIFQANITQQFKSSFAGCTRSMALQALELSKARYGAYLELPGGRCVVSMSPELFLHFDAVTRSITARPIKGTSPAIADPQDLLDSPKDAAELHMITDLMRNDLGRVCDYGSINVTDARSVETHPTVHHGVSTITGRLRNGVDLPDVLTATFPPGSVTGAPKIRAMQIIEELEQRPRELYCGTIGMLSHSGDFTLNVAIRTMLMRGRRSPECWNHLEGELTYGAGGGIVADSEPLAEYRESIDKAAVLRRVLEERSRQPRTTSSGQE